MSLAGPFVRAGQPRVRVSAYQDKGRGNVAGKGRRKYNRKLRRMESLVRWEGISGLYDTWKSATNLKNAPRFLIQKEYRARHLL